MIGNLCAKTAVIFCGGMEFAGIVTEQCTNGQFFSPENDRVTITVVLTSVKVARTSQRRPTKKKRPSLPWSD